MAIKKLISFKKPPKGSVLKLKKVSVQKLKSSKVPVMKTKKVKFAVKKIPNRFGR